MGYNSMNRYIDRPTKPNLALLNPQALQWAFIVKASVIVTDIVALLGDGNMMLKWCQCDTYDA